MLLGVIGKVLEIDSQKILRADPGLYSQYFPSYDIFGETQIFRHPIFNLFLSFFGSPKKCLQLLLCFLGYKGKVLEFHNQ